MSTTDDKKVRTARAMLGNITRFGTAAEAMDARRDLKAAKLERYISQLVAEAPPFTQDQLDRLTALLNGK